ncbi:MAG: transposase [Calditrichaeota bacterium]|nr:transposase [Calditrichota bacterium]
MTKRYEIQDHTHFLTFSCYKRLRLFTNSDLCQLFITHLNKARQRRQFMLFAFVIMPDHVHLLLSPSDNDTIAKILLSLKKSFSIEALQLIYSNNSDLFNKLVVY